MLRVERSMIIRLKRGCKWIWQYTHMKSNVNSKWPYDRWLWVNGFAFTSRLPYVQKFHSNQSTLSVYGSEFWLRSTISTLNQWIVALFNALPTSEQHACIDYHMVFIAFIVMGKKLCVVKKTSISTYRLSAYLIWLSCWPHTVAIRSFLLYVIRVNRLAAPKSGTIACNNSYLSMSNRANFFPCVQCDPFK